MPNSLTHKKATLNGFFPTYQDVGELTNVIPRNFNELGAPIGELFLVKDDTGKNIAVFFVDKITHGSIVRIFVGNPEPIPITDPEIAIEKPPVVKVPTTGTWLGVGKPSGLAPANFTINPGEFVILAHRGKRVGTSGTE